VTWKRTVIDVVERPTIAGLIVPALMFSRSGAERFCTCNGALTSHPREGCGAAVMTAVGTEVAFVEPSRLVAVTRTRSVLPTSTPLSVYVLLVAPLIAEQLPPLRSQRRHEKANVIGCGPVHLPSLAVSVCSCCGVPAIVGGDSLLGGAWATAAPLSASAAVAASTSMAVPAASASIFLFRAPFMVTPFVV
jgi:hypothetical protein